METNPGPSPAPAHPGPAAPVAAVPPPSSRFTDIVGLRESGIFPKGREPTVRTLRAWTKLRRIPFHKVGRFVYFDPVEVEAHIRGRLRVPARGER